MRNHYTFYSIIIYIYIFNILNYIYIIFNIYLIFIHSDLNIPWIFNRIKEISVEYKDKI